MSVQKMVEDMYSSKSLSSAEAPAGYPYYIQLFRERLSEKMHATIPKSIVGSFEFTVLQRNLKEWHERPWLYVCERE